MVVLTSFPPPDEGIRHMQPDTGVQVNNRYLGKGTVFITESRFSWVRQDTGEGFSLEYPHISLHAVARNPQECLLMMIDADIDNNAEENESGSESDGSDGSPSTEMKLIPDDPAALSAMYQAMNDCQALHPDPDDSDPENDIFEDADGEEEGEYHVQDGAGSDDEEYEEAHNGRGDEHMEVEAGQFEDADSDIDT